MFNYWNLMTHCCVTTVMHGTAVTHGTVIHGTAVTHGTVTHGTVMHGTAVTHGTVVHGTAIMHGTAVTHAWKCNAWNSCNTCMEMYSCNTWNCNPWNSCNTIRHGTTVTHETAIHETTIVP